MYSRFTERAEKVLMLAQEEARRLGHNVVGTEHLLLGLVHEGEGVAAKALKNLGVDLGRLRSETLKLVGKGEEPIFSSWPLRPEQNGYWNLPGTKPGKWESITSAQSTSSSA